MRETRRLENFLQASHGPHRKNPPNMVPYKTSVKIEGPGDRDLLVD